jgi:Zn-dependent protease with chaperone function
VTPPSIGSPWSPAVLRSLAGATDQPYTVAAAGWQRVLLATGPGLWVAGALVLLTACAGRCLRHRRRLLESAQPVERRLAERAAAHARSLGLARSPRLLISPRVTVPQVGGLVRPVLALPVGFADAPQLQTDAALVHELAHLRRRDPWRAAGLLAIGALLWIHPIVWLAIARLGVLRECACDRLAAQRLGDVDGYRRALAWWGRLALDGRAGRRPRGENTRRERESPGLALLRRHHPVVERLDRLQQLARGDDPVGWRRRAIYAAAFTLAAALPAIRPPAPLLLPDPAIPGCLIERYAVLAELGRRSAATAAQERNEVRPAQPPIHGAER